MKENLNIMKEEVSVVGVKALDFKTPDGNTIKGYKFYYVRNLSDDEKKQSSFGKICEYKFLAKDNLDDIDRYKNMVYPCKATIEYQVVSLNKAPQLLDIKC